ncbi:hypothetical protein EV361DRAFT_387503 [Lentinula raphanica]|nr:hypothetical protein EV361DRAFT_387503 [Lentinula raphanica]
MNKKFTLANLEVLSTSVEDTQPIQRFRLFTGRFYANVTKLEFCWGLEKGELDLWSPMNCISVRADIACLFLDWELALIPTNEILQNLSDIIVANLDGHIDQRRCCFEVIPPGEYEYYLVPLKKDPPTVFVLGNGNGSTSPQKLEFSSPHFSRVKLNIHPAFAVVHAGYEMYSSIHKHQPYFRRMGIISGLCCEPIPQEFRARPDIQYLSSRISGRGDDRYSSESDDSVEIIEDVDCSGEDDGVRIQSWLESLPPSAPAVEEVLAKSEGECSRNAWRDSLVDGE